MSKTDDLEFVNRMNSQRKLLKVVNRGHRWREDLYGISEAAIDRWVSANGLARDSDLVTLLVTISRELRFLATKSQEQLTESYELKSKSVMDNIDLVQNVISGMAV